MQRASSVVEAGTEFVMSKADLRATTNFATRVGLDVGRAVGEEVGFRVLGADVGRFDDAAVVVGASLGAVLVGCVEGETVGCLLGSVVGDRDGE